MNIKKTLAAGVAGTSMMTLFSYIVSGAKKKNFIEPEVLFDLLKRLPLTERKKILRIVSWMGHYDMGLTFAVIYDMIWRKSKIKPSAKSGAVLGGLSGIAGIVIWDGIFKFHPNPPDFHLKRYYGHLLLAHIIFGAFAGITYKKTSEKDNS